MPAGNQYNLRFGVHTTGAQVKVNALTGQVVALGKSSDVAQGSLVGQAASTRSVGVASTSAATSVASLSAANAAATGTSLSLGTTLFGTFKRLTAVLSIVALLHGSVSQIGDSVDVFKTFERQMAVVQAVTSATGEEFKQLTGLARELGETTEFTATQAAGAQVALGRASFDTNEILAASPDVLNLATAAQLGMGEAAKITASIIRGYNLDATEAGLVTDVLAKAAASSNSDVQQMGEALKFVAPVAAGLRIPIQDAAAAIGVLSDSGLQASLAGTGLRRVLTELANPGNKARKELALFGVDAYEVRDALLGEDGLNKSMAILADAGVDVSAAMEIAGQRGGPALLNLINQAGRVEELGDKLDSASGSTKEMADIIRDTLKGATDELTSAVESFKIEMTGGMKPALEATTDSLRDFFRESTDGAEELGKSMGKITAAAGGAFVFFLENIDLILAALKVWLGIKIGVWILGMIGSLAKATIALLSYTGAQVSATAATAAHGVTTSVVSPIVDQYGRAIIRTTTSTAAATKATGFWTLSLTPLSIGLGVVLAAILVINEAIKDWSGTMQREIEAMVKQAGALHLSLEKIKESTIAAIDSGDYDRVTREITSQSQALAKHEQGALAGLVARKEANEELAVATAAFNSARSEGLSEEEREDFGLDSLRELGAAMAEAQTKFDETSESATKSKATVNLYTRSIHALNMALTTLDKPSAAGIDRGGSDEEKQLLKFAQRMASLEEQILAQQALNKAYQDGEDQLNSYLQVLEVEKKLRGLSRGLTIDQTQALRERLEVLVEEQSITSGEKMIRDLQIQLDSSKRLTEAQREGQTAVEEVTRALTLEAAARKAATDASVTQADELEDLNKKVSDQTAREALTEEIRLLDEETQALDRSIEARQQGDVASKALERQLRLEDAIRVAMVGHVEDEREEIEKSIKAREASVNVLEDETQVLAPLRTALVELTAQRDALREGTKSATDALAANLIIIANSIDPTGALADKVRELSEELNKIETEISFAEIFDDLQSEAIGAIGTGVLTALDGSSAASAIAAFGDALGSAVEGAIASAMAESLGSTGAAAGGVIGAIAGYFVGQLFSSLEKNAARQAANRAELNRRLEELHKTIAELTATIRSDLITELHELLEVLREAVELNTGLVTAMKAVNAGLETIRNRLLGLNAEPLGQTLEAAQAFNDSLAAFRLELELTAEVARDAAKDEAEARLADDGDLNEGVGDIQQDLDEHLQNIDDNLERSLDRLDQLPINIDELAEKLINTFLGIDFAFQSIIATSEQLRASIIALGLDQERELELLAQLEVATAIRLQQLENDVLQRLVNVMKQIPGQAEAARQLQAQINQSRFQIEITILEIQLRSMELMTTAFENMLEIAQAFGDDIGNFQVPNIDIPSGGSGGGGGGGGSSRQDDRERLIERINAQIEAWQRLELGPLTNQALRLTDTYNDLVAEARRLNVETGALTAAFRRASRNMINEMLAPFEDLGLSDLELELRGINEHFADMRAAFRELGASQQDMLRLAQAQAAAMQDFWERATEGIRGFLEELRAGDPRITSEDEFLDAQSDFRDLQARAARGDLEALALLEDAGRRYEAAAEGFLGEGVGSLQVLDEIMEGLEAVIGRGTLSGDVGKPTWEADKIALQSGILRVEEDSNTVLRGILTSLGGSVPSRSGGDLTYLGESIARTKASLFRRTAKGDGPSVAANFNTFASRDTPSAENSNVSFDRLTDYLSKRDVTLAAEKQKQRRVDAAASLSNSSQRDRMIAALEDSNVQLSAMVRNQKHAIRASG